jgi:hypothetical protein
VSVDWERYRKCPVCGAALGKQCRTRSSYGYYPEVAADEPHSTRELRAGREAG